MSKNTVHVHVAINKDIFTQLKALPHVLAKKTSKRMIGKAASILIAAAQPKVPVGGERTGRKKNKPHLKDTLGVSPVRKYFHGQLQMVAVGPRYTHGGNHGHLVEFGHKLKGGGGFGGRTRAQPFMQPAYDKSLAAIWLAQNKIAKRAVAKHLKSIKDIK